MLVCDLAAAEAAVFGMRHVLGPWIVLRRARPEERGGAPGPVWIVEFAAPSAPGAEETLYG